MDSSLYTGFGRRGGVGALRLLAVLLLVSVVVAIARAAVPKVGEKAPDFKAQALDDSSVKLSETLKKGPVVLVILRGYPGYQCPICNMQVGGFLKDAAQFEERKAQVLLIYPGPSEGLKQHANEFVTGKTLPKSFRMVLDPDYALIKKYDLRWNAPNETSYPSTFVIDTKGMIRFAKVSHSHGDRAKTADILKALDSKETDTK